MEAEVMDNLIELEKSIPRETMLSIVYISGYIERYSDSEEDDTMLYYDKFSEYFAALDRGGLRKPTDSVVQWTTFCFIFFTHAIENSKVTLCGKFLAEQFSEISSRYQLMINKRQYRALAYVLLKNYAVMQTPRSSKEVKLKELKLS